MAGFKAENILTGEVTGSVNIPVDALKKIAAVPKHKKAAVYCASGIRSGIAARILAQNGYKEVYNISGGFMSHPKV